MGMGPRTNVYRIGSDPLTQLIYFFSEETLSDTINGKYVVGDPMTQFKLIK